MTKNNIIEMMIISDVSNTNIYSLKPSLEHCFTFMYINAIEVCIELYFIQIGDKTKLPLLYCMSVQKFFDGISSSKIIVIPIAI